MPLTFDVPVEVGPPRPKASTILCTRVTMLPETMEVAYEFMVYDEGGTKVADLHSRVVFGKDLDLETALATTEGRPRKIGPFSFGTIAGQEITVRHVHDAIQALGYNLVQEQTGPGMVS